MWLSADPFRGTPSDVCAFPFHLVIDDAVPRARLSFLHAKRGGITFALHCPSLAIRFSDPLNRLSEGRIALRLSES